MTKPKDGSKRGFTLKSERVDPYIENGAFLGCIASYDACQEELSGVVERLGVMERVGFY